MIRHARLLVVLPLLAACPTFEYGPEAYELTASCVELGPGGGVVVDDDGEPRVVTCSRFEHDNGAVLLTSPQPQPLVLVFGFEAFERNLDYVTLQYERPGLPPSRLICPFGYGLEDEDVSADGIQCLSVGLDGHDPEDPGDQPSTPEGAASGVIDVRARIDAAVPGQYAISAWLTDDNDFESPVLRWQFTVQDPPEPDRVPE
ncbi:hypothetical protein [Paraliomyxa miuraensis]|uniref:hypothetical protein n=1 Tax=Paraliomyxa miuraensis TaxID=376150 RepID=UPI00224F1974|nr:hypothetical protein [Paraliomyxa miuraensis]MCX4247069.1 hypothetical protein [Paraliomyxa miuraensis]